jgi:hypothetical protein
VWESDHTIAVVQGALRAQVRAYFNELLIDVNLRFSFVPPCSS